MTFEEFMKEVQEHILEYLPKDVSKKVRKMYVKKAKDNQDQIFHGLFVCFQDAEGISVTPSVFLEQCYQMYEAGEPFPCVLRKLAETYQNAVADVSKIKNVPDLIKDYNWVKTRFQICPCDTEINQERIKSVKHISKGPVTGLIHVVVDEDPENFAAIPVTKRLFEHWGVTEDQLAQDVMEANKRFGVKLYRISDTMYCLTNDIKINGSGLLFDKFVMEVIHRAFGDFYILPVSIHECMIVPVSSGESYDELKNMLREANSKVVKACNFFSDEVMMYRK